MKSKIPLLVAVLIGAIVMVFTLGAASSNSRVYEYRVIEREAHDPQDLLNHFGKEGWELVAVTPAPGSTSFETYYLKRESR